jgi:membrane protease YdiL (CAAX protease family)
VSLKAVVILLSVLLGLASVWSHSRRGMGPLLALGLPLDLRELGNAALGAAIGLFAIGATFLVAYTTRHVEVVAVGPPAPLVNDIVSFLAVPFVEELLFRSALLGGLLVILPPNHKWVAVTCSGCLTPRCCRPQTIFGSVRYADAFHLSVRGTTRFRQVDRKNHTGIG